MQAAADRQARGGDDRGTLVDMSDDVPGPLSPAIVPEERRVGRDLQVALAEVCEDLGAPQHNADLAHRVEWLVDLLVLRGHLMPGHRKMLDKMRGEASPVRLANYVDKRALVGADIDCASLLPLCQGRCCAFAVSLSIEDLEEGKLGWEVHQPYLLRRNPTTGYCGCLGDDGRCTVYADRPGTCRAYDCRHDPRVWVDFEARIPAPLATHLRPPFAPAPGSGPAR